MRKPLTAISNLAVTNRCNGRCNTCNIWKMDPLPDPGLDQLTRFIHDNRPTLRHLRFIQLTGGEPFLRDDLPAIVAAVQEALPRCMIWIPTNGLQPERTAEMTREMLLNVDEPLLGVTVSVDGEGKSHDIQRGIDGSFKLAMATLKALSELKQRHPRLRISTGFTLTTLNYKQAPIVQKMSYRYGADFSVRPVNISEHYYQNLGENRQMSPEDMGPVVAQMAHTVVSEKGVLRGLTNLAYLQGVKEFIAGGRTMACSAAEESVFIDAAGDVYPCIVMNHKMGNAFQTPLKDILVSAEAESAREKVRRLECPTCWLECDAFRDISRDWARLLRALMWSFNQFA
jgi:MoaA/NifB/PqqE/SkfB family radical SAM enzyme